MNGGSMAMLTNLRNRPPAERHILAVTVYAASAAVVIAVGITSLDKTFRLAARQATSDSAAIPPAVTPRPAGPRTLGAETGDETNSPPSPLVAIRQAGEAIAASVREASQAFRQASRRAAALEEPPPAEKTSPAPPTGRLATLPPDLALTRPAHPPAKAAVTVSGLAAGLKAKSYSTYAAARALAWPLDAAGAPDDQGIARRAAAILQYNLGEISKAAVDLYRHINNSSL